MTDFDDSTGARRTQYRRTRTHHVVEHGGPPTMPPDAIDDVDPWVDHDDSGFIGVDPRLVRVGAIAAAAVLMIPIALALRDDDGGAVRSDATVTSVAPEVAAAPVETVVTVPITAAAVASAAAPSPAGHDAESASVQVVAEVEPPACAGIYTVAFNDYWNRFPRSSGASVEQWLAANQATLDTPLYVGDELCIPAGATAPTPAPTTTSPPATTAAPVTTAAPETTAAPATAAAQPPPPVVTAPPATTPAAPAPTPSPTDPASVEALIREIWPDEVEERALIIAKRESGLRPWVNNWCCYGVFAIYFEVGKSWLADLGVTSAQQLYDARTNIQAAYHLYTLSGWGPWRQTDPGA